MKKILKSLIITILCLTCMVKPIYADEYNTSYDYYVYPEAVISEEEFLKKFDEYENDEYIEMPLRDQLYLENKANDPLNQEIFPVMVVIKQKYSDYNKIWTAADLNLKVNAGIIEYRYDEPGMLTKDEYLELGIKHQHLLINFGKVNPLEIVNTLKESDKVLYIGLISFANTNIDAVSGDIDNNTEIDVSDLTLLSQYILGDVEFDLKQQVCADVNADDEVNLQDLALLKQYVMNDNVQLGVAIK